MKSLTRVAIARPRLMIIFWIVLAAACLPLTIQLSGALKAGGFDNPRGEAAHGQQTLNPAFKLAPQTLQVVLHKPSGDVTAAVADAELAARQAPHVTSIADYRQNPQWLSDNRQTTFFQMSFRADETTIQGEIKDLRSRLARSLAADGVIAHVTGAQALDYDLTVQSTRDASTAELIAFPLLFIVLLLVFRSVAAMLLPIVVAGLALIIAMAVGFLGTRITNVSVLFENAVSLIGLAVSVDYSLFIVKRYRDELAAGADYIPALQTAMRTAGRSVVFSGFAVVVALLALFIPRLMVFGSIALAGIVVTLITLAIAMTFLPAVLCLLGPRINWATLRLPGRSGTSGSLPRFIARLHRRPLPLLLVLVALFGLMALPIAGIRLQTAVASASILPGGADSRQGIERLQADLSFPDLFPVQIVLTSPTDTGQATLLASTRAAAKLAASQPRVHTVQAVSSLGLPAPALDAAANGNLTVLPPQARSAFSQLWTRYRGRYVSQVVVVPTQGPDSDATHSLVRSLRSKLPAVAQRGVTAQVTGDTAAGVDFDNVLVSSLPWILGAVALVTFALLARAFRSWRLPLLALALNAFVVAASLGLLTAISQRGFGQRVDSITPTLIFAIMFGLSMDYMVIMVSRMRERYAELGEHRAAIQQGMARTAGLVNSAALIMVAVFASFLSAKISVVQQLGLGLAIAVILDAVVIRLLVMPAALYLIGPRCWGRALRPQPAIPAPDKSAASTARSQPESAMKRRQPQ